MSRSGRAFFRAFTRPRSWNTFSCAFSRTEQVLNRIRSASSGRSVASKPRSARRISAIFSESYAFIWQPNVRMKTLPATLVASGARLGPRELVGREQPRAKDLTVGVQRVVRPRAALRDGGRDDDQVQLIANLRTGREPRRPLVDRDRHPVEMAYDAAVGLRRNRRGAELRQGRRSQQCRQEGEVRGEANDHAPAAAGKGKWWRIRDSNPGPADYDSVALTS